MNAQTNRPAKECIEDPLTSCGKLETQTKSEVSVKTLQRSLKIQKRINKLLKKRAKDKMKAILKSGKHGNNSQKSQDLHTSSKLCPVPKSEIEKTPLKDSNSEGTSANGTLSHRID